MRRVRGTRVGDIATRPVAIVEPAATLAECARRMRDQHVGCVVVVDYTRPEGRPIGIVTDRDIVLEAVAPSLDPATVSVREIITAPLAFVDEHEDVVRALACMREHGVRRLAITGTGGQLAGIVTLDDVSAALAEQFAALPEVWTAELTREVERRPAHGDPFLCRAKPQGAGPTNAPESTSAEA